MANSLDHLQNFAAACNAGGSFFDFPTWYKYLDCSSPGSVALPAGASIFDALPLIILAIVEILLRIAGLVAIAFVVYGGVQYVTSQGEPDRVAKSKGTIINALVGLIISTFAIAIVAFVGQRVG